MTIHDIDDYANAEELLKNLISKESILSFFEQLRTKIFTNHISNSDILAKSRPWIFYSNDCAIGCRSGTIPEIQGKSCIGCILLARLNRVYPPLVDRSTQSSIRHEYVVNGKIIHIRYTILNNPNAVEIANSYHTNSSILENILKKEKIKTPSVFIYQCSGKVVIVEEATRFGTEYMKICTAGIKKPQIDFLRSQGAYIDQQIRKFRYKFYSFDKKTDIEFHSTANDKREHSKNCEFSEPEKYHYRLMIFPKRKDTCLGETSEYNDEEYTKTGAESYISGLFSCK